jgi:hypothetical protein
MENTNTYILQIEGKDLLQSGKKGLKIKNSNKKKYKATLDFSLECIQLDKVAKLVYKDDDAKSNIFYKLKDKQYTDAVISVTFKYAIKEFVEQYIKTDKINKYFIRYEYIDKVKLDKIAFDNNDKYIIDNELIAFRVTKNINNNDYFNNDTILSARDIRKKLYDNDFKFNGRNYCRFKRSSGSSRIGKCLFILKDLYEDMIKWSYMGLTFNEANECDLAALEAYISLTTSSIIDTIKIRPENILLIKDYKSLFTDTVMATRIKTIDGDNRLATDEDIVEIENNIWDGQSLLDVQVFSGKYYDKGMLLLRNRMTKTCAFNTNIQKFFYDNGIKSLDELDYIATGAKKLEDVLMITTPSSIKYLRFNNNFMDYIAELDDTWGIVKYDKPTHYFNGSLVQTHYQLLNTLQMDRIDIENFLQPSINYVGLLKNDIDVFRYHLKMSLGDTVEEKELNDTNDLMFSLLELNNDVEKTDIFQNFRDDVIDSYKKNMKKGHILIEGNYSVLFGNSLEMLKATIKDKTNHMAFNGASVLVNNEIHNTNFKYGDEILGCRSPHVTMGNLALLKNVECPVLDKYFNLTRQIVCVNSINYNLLEILSSSDFDSDALLLTNNVHCISALKKNFDMVDGKYINNFLAPTNCIDEEFCKPYPRKNNADQKWDLDIKTSENLIGEIINCSQMLNGKLWQMINDGFSVNSEEVQKLYAAICQLDVMSCLEIDKAKREIPVNNKVELDDIRNNWLDFELVNKKTYKKASSRIVKIYDDMIYHKLNKNSGEEYREEYDNQLEDYKKKLENYKLTKVRPQFFKFVAKKENEEHKYFYKAYNTTMDILEDVIIKKIKDTRVNRNSKNDLMQLIRLIDNSKLNSKNTDYRQIENLIAKVEEHKKECDSIWSNKNIESEEKYIKCKQKQNEIAQYMKDKINKETMYKIIHKLCHAHDYDYIARKLITILFKSSSEIFLGIFKDKKEKLLILSKSQNGELEIYGIKFTKK